MSSPRTFLKTTHFGSQRFLKVSRSRILDLLGCWYFPIIKFMYITCYKCGTRDAQRNYELGKVFSLSPPRTTKSLLFFASSIPFPFISDLDVFFRSIQSQPWSFLIFSLSEPLISYNQVLIKKCGLFLHSMCYDKCKL